MDFFDEDVMVSRVIQSTDTRCGAACCVMVFSRYAMHVSEDEAALDIVAQQLEPLEWYADPHAVAKCLSKDRLPDNLDFTVTWQATDFVNESLAKIVQTIRSRQMPCLTLIYGGAHWVVIDGVRLMSGEAADILVGLNIVDPYGSEPARRFVPAEVFSRKYLQPNEFGQKWLNKFIVLGDNLPANPIEVMSGPPPNPDFLQKGALFFADTKAPSIYSAAVSSMTHYGFTDVTKHLGGGAPLSNRCVTALPNYGNDYLLVFLDTSADAFFRRSICVALDAVTGELLEATADFNRYVLSDANAISVADLTFGTGNYELDDKIYYAETPSTLSRFSVIRKVRFGDLESFVLPAGVIVRDLPRAIRGGGA